MSERSMTTEERLAILREERRVMEDFDLSRPLGPGELSPRQRVAALVDPDSLVEMSALSRRLVDFKEAGPPTDGVIAGLASVDGRPVAVVCDDAVAARATDGKVGRRKLLRAVDQAVYRRMPLVHLSDGGAQFAVEERDLADPRRAGYRDASERSALFVTVRAGAGAMWQGTSADADVVLSSTPGGGADISCPDEATAISLARELVGLVPDLDRPLSRRTPRPPARALDDADPCDDPVRLLAGVLDDGTAVRFDSRGGVHAALGAVEGYPVCAVVVGDASSPLLGHDGLGLLTRVAELARRFRLPLLTFQQVEGYDPHDVEQPSFARGLAHLLGVLRTTRAVRLSVITSAGFSTGDFPGGAVGAGFDLVWAWPTARVALTDATAEPSDLPSSPWEAADRCLVDDVVAPSETREWVARVVGLSALARAHPPAKYDRGMSLTDLV